MHSVGREIEFTRPCYGAHFDTDPFKLSGIDQMGKNPPKEGWFETNDSLYPITKPHLQITLADLFQTDHAPWRTIQQWRHHGNGAIFTVDWPVLAACHASINSA